MDDQPPAQAVSPLPLPPAPEERPQPTANITSNTTNVQLNYQSTRVTHNPTRSRASSRRRTTISRARSRTPTSQRVPLPAHHISPEPPALASGSEQPPQQTLPAEPLPADGAGSAATTIYSSPASTTPGSQPQQPGQPERDDHAPVPAPSGSLPHSTGQQSAASAAAEVNMETIESLLPAKRPFETMHTLLKDEDGEISRTYSGFDGSPDIGFGKKLDQYCKVYLNSDQRTKDVPDKVAHESDSSAD